MKKYILLSIGLFLLLSCGTDGTKKYSDNTGRFAATFPEAPETFQDTIFTKIGDLIFYQFQTAPENDDNLLYSIGYVDYPVSFVDGATKKQQYNLFLYFQKSLLDDPSITSTGILNVSILGYLGRQFKWNNTSTNELIKNRLYLVNNRLYILTVKTPLANNFNKKIDAFFDSFELINTDPNPNAQEINVEKSSFTIDFPGPTEIQKQESTHENTAILVSLLKRMNPTLKTTTM